MATQLSIRNVSPELARRLKALSSERGESLNTTVLRLLEAIVGVKGRREELKRFQTWSAEDLREFESVLDGMRQVDEKLWK
jgi:hypothetical protein